MDTVGFTRLVSKSSESEPSDCKVAGVRVGQFTASMALKSWRARKRVVPGAVELKFLVRSSVYPFTVNHLNSL